MAEVAELVVGALPEEAEAEPARPALEEVQPDTLVPEGVELAVVILEAELAVGVPAVGVLVEALVAVEVAAVALVEALVAILVEALAAELAVPEAER
jgi:hypothetical protein